MSSLLYTPFQAGALRLPNRFVMAPLTRGRAGADRIPKPIMAEYYAQRATAGLIVTEATAISPQGYGWFGAPAMYDESHVAGWKKVTEAVHRAGGRIVLQLWHMGRVSHPDFLDGDLPVAPSAIAAEGNAHSPSGNPRYVIPRALETYEIPAIANAYAMGARAAKAAGFDGVEIHAANGYLIDQFLRDSSNQRTDGYGGSPENRARFLLEVTDAVTRAWSPDRVGVRLSPVNHYNGMQDSTPARTFTHAARELGKFGLAYLHVLEALPGHPRYVPGERVSPLLRAAFKGPFIANGGYDAQKADLALRSGEADLIAFGVPFIANPDLVERFRTGAPLNAPRVESFYNGGSEGYTDYPTLAAGEPVPA